MNAPENLFLPDVQSSADKRQLAIQRVGVKAITHPIQVRTADGIQPSVATVDMYVGLPKEVKGTHMSRFLEVLEATHAPLDFTTLHTLMQTMLLRLEADRGHIRFSLPYFVRKTAPVSGVSSLMDYRVDWLCEQRDGQITVTQTVLVPVTSLCPCSKKISAYGAHNQRSHITVSVRLSEALPVEALIAVAEQSASCELWGLLKRPDEKYVTERAYENPKFVEDLVRDVAIGIAALPGVDAWKVASENFESIHNHSAYAELESDNWCGC